MTQVLETIPLEPTQTTPPVISSSTDILTLEGAADYLQVTQDDLLIAIAPSAIPTGKSRLPCQSINGQWRFSKSAIDQWLSIPHTNTQPTQVFTPTPPDIAAAKRRALLQLLEQWKNEPDREEEDTETWNLLGEALQNSTLRCRS